MAKFALPNTSTSIVVWYRDGKAFETRISTPSNHDQLVVTMLKHRVGRNEIRAVKADPQGVILNTSFINLASLVGSMTRLPRS